MKILGVVKMEKVDVNLASLRPGRNIIAIVMATVLILIMV